MSFGSGDYNANTVVHAGGRTGFLLLHGLGGSPVEFRYLAQGLARRGMTVVCPVMAGHGATRVELESSRWTEWYLSAESELLKMRQHCDTIIVGGVSAGALVALRLTAEHPEIVSASILYAPTFWPDGWAIPRSLQLFRLVTTRWFANLFQLRETAPYGIKDARLRKMVIDHLTADGTPVDDVFGFRGGVLFEFGKLARDVKKRLGTIKQQALIFHPRDDDQSHLANSLMLQSKLGGRVQTLVLEDCYHLVVLDRQRQVVLDHTHAFAVALGSESSGRPQIAEPLPQKLSSASSNGHATTP
jgi:carboxylesterase